MNKVKLLFLSLLLLLFSSACSLSIGSGTANTSSDGGIWISSDKGETWKQVSLIPSITGKPQSLGNIDIKVMSLDPQDTAAVYTGTIAQGLYYTHNFNYGWNQMMSLEKETINDVKVDPNSTCIIYSAIANRLHRSNNCGRSWQQIYFDNNPGVVVTTIAIDHYNSDNIYIGTSRGEILKSIDRGVSWRAIQRANEAIARLIVSPQDSRLIFVATIKNNIYSFNSNTITNPDNPANIDRNFSIENWTDLSEVLKEFNLGVDFRDFAISVKDGTMLLASSQAIVRSPDQGNTWERINLLTTEKDAIINAIAIGPQNSQEIYYVTNTTFFKSLDGGISWSTKKLRTSRAGSELLIDISRPNIIYMGTRKIK
jgi:photosystem II stability/assembly factor-like uncharacterized protein